MNASEFDALLARLDKLASRLVSLGMLAHSATAEDAAAAIRELRAALEKDAAAQNRNGWPIEPCCQAPNACETMCVMRLRWYDEQVATGGYITKQDAAEEPIAWLSMDDLAYLQRDGECTIYQERQEFTLAPGPEDMPLYTFSQVAEGKFVLTLEELNDLKSRFSAERCGLQGSRDWAIKTLSDALGIEPGKALEYYAREAAERIAGLAHPAPAAAVTDGKNLVLQLATELCDAIDAAEQDIGGCRPIQKILGELGPAVDEANATVWEPK